MREPKNTLAEMLASKRELIRLALLATVLAFSVGVLASLVAAITAVPSAAIYVGAGLLTVAALVLLAADIRLRLAFEDRLEGVLFIDSTRNELVRVRGYELSEDLARAMRAVKAESRAIYSEWENDPLVPVKAPPDDPKVAEAPDEASKREPSYVGIYRVAVKDDHLTRQTASRLLDEGLQFVLLEELSTHLSTHFNNSKSDQVTELSREDIPSFLLQNRVLNLLTTPIEQRDVFLKAFPDPAKKPEGVLYSLWGSDGSMYSRFDLNLPKESKVSYLGRGALRIETKRLDLEIWGRYTGSSAVVSRAFIEHYMGQSPDRVACRKVEVVLRGRIKPIALLSDRGWEHYHWLDSFRARLRKSVDIEAFRGHIHWDLVEPMLFALRGQFQSIHQRLQRSSSDSDA